MSRNAATVKVAEAAGYDRVADLWRRIGAGTTPKAFPSIALGVFEATPFTIASAYTIFTNGGQTRGLRSVLRIQRGEEELVAKDSPTHRVARADTTYLVTSMMRSVLSEGTGAAVRTRRASVSTPPARPARPTTCATRGSSVSHRRCSRWSGGGTGRQSGCLGLQRARRAALPIWLQLHATRARRPR